MNSEEAEAKITKLMECHAICLELSEIIRSLQLTQIMVQDGHEETMEAARNFLKSWNKIDRRTGREKNDLTV